MDQNLKCLVKILNLIADCCQHAAVQHLFDLWKSSVVQFRILSASIKSGLPGVLTVKRSEREVEAAVETGA